MVERLLPGLAQLQNLHPVIVHFPVALLTAAVLLYWLAWIMGGRIGNATGLGSFPFSSCAFVLLLLGTLTAALAVGTGLYADGGVMVSFSVRDKLLEPHKKLMLVTLGLSLVLSGWALFARPFPRKARALFCLGLLVMATVMTLGADFGGRMVYTYNAGGSACPQPIDFEK